MKRELLAVLAIALVAAGALSALLGHGITLRQGRATARACLIETRLEGADILVGGCVQAA